MTEMIESGQWIQLFVTVGASVIMAVYVYQLVLPWLRKLVGATNEVEDRTTELLDEYLRGKQGRKPEHQPAEPTYSGTLYRLSAFTSTPEGGNPAGVWMGDELPPVEEMQRIAADIGYSETAFIAPLKGDRRTIRYFSPKDEVPFCGHATIASGVQIGMLSGDGEFVFDTAAGDVRVVVGTRDGLPLASLTSVEPRHRLAPQPLLDDVLTALRWDRSQLDPAIPPAMAFAGAWHLVIAAATHDRLNRLEYDYQALMAHMLKADLTTIQLVWQESPEVFHARNPFPVGGIVEDPATGAAAAAFGGYLRDSGLIQAPASILIRQGEAMGRPSRLMVDIPTEGGITVSGNAVVLEQN